jgi:anaerobic ribonucleoside-triphosphate reductase activating protein
MRIHQILKESNANGPGLRFVVWVQGCGRKCLGCFNPYTHDPCDGYEIEASKIIGQIPLGKISGITVSGGEPFEQAEELSALLKEAGQMGLNRMVYTGYIYEELSALQDSSYRKCLAEIDLLIDGAYEKDNPPYMPWTGSGNQRLIQLQCGQIKKIYERSDMKADGNPAGEIIIDANGGIVATGIIDSGIFML